ncbi:hypothetical protein DKM44_12845 [Deinococcus irradiatisoli]|uniref:Uncharacterized protein n=1 Tax=Deinococcus irradiatisoli TaxID=2202254 RepID=A0A2Z3JMJ1_9DEIO|nr:hypothetical protein [Deinococcus irradiatisoli]AWN24009.1 hypothetical protein DKM44_12845 [Deinococcus irradiatisoli]
MEYRILFGFVRGQRGDIISVTPDDAKALLASGLIAEVEPKQEASEPSLEERLETFAKGGGWYHFPQGAGEEPLKVQGREAALAELAKRGS